MNTVLRALMLKNDGSLLPLDASKIKAIALIGQQTFPGLRGLAAREISSGFCAARAMSKRTSHRLLVRGQR